MSMASWRIVVHLETIPKRGSGPGGKEPPDGTLLSAAFLCILGRRRRRPPVCQDENKKGEDPLQENRS